MSLGDLLQKEVQQIIAPVALKMILVTNHVGTSNDINEPKMIA